MSHVLNVGRNHQVPAPDLGARAGTSFLTGIARTGDRLVSRLDVDRLVGGGTEPAGLSA